LGCHGFQESFKAFHGPLDIGLIHTLTPVETVETVEVSVRLWAGETHTPPLKLWKCWKSPIGRWSLSDASCQVAVLRRGNSATQRQR
jgi:hypothetical protein